MNLGKRFMIKGDKAGSFEQGAARLRELLRLISLATSPSCFAP
jgi:hypothetical protein